MKTTKISPQSTVNSRQSLIMLSIVYCLLSTVYSFSQNISINSTGAPADVLNMLEVLQASSTANSVGLYVGHTQGITGTGYGLKAIKTGASTINIGGYFTASGATSNYAGIFDQGRVGIANTTPGNLFSINTPTTADALADVLIGTSATTQKALVLQDKASQTADIFEIQNNDGTNFMALNTATTNTVYSTSPFVAAHTQTAATGVLTYKTTFNFSCNNTVANGNALIRGFQFTTKNSSTTTVDNKLGIIGAAFTATLASSQNSLASRFVGQTTQLTTTAAQTGTIADAVALQINSPVFTGSKPVANTGIQISNQGVSGETTAIGLEILAQTGATNNYGILSNADIAVKDAHLISQQTTTPTIATGAASTAASLTNATDVAGHISITTNTTAGIGATITFNKAYSVAPIVIITATDALSSAEIAKVYVTTPTLSTFTITFNAAPIANTKTYNYYVIGTQ